MKRLATLAIALFLLVSCSKQASIVQTQKQKTVKIQKILTNIPVYPGAKYDLKNTFIYEAGNIKAAVITLKASGKLKDVVEFYKGKMIEEGWDLISSFIYQNTASMFFDSPDSSCSIEAQDRGGSLNIVIRVGTKAALQDVK